MLNLSLRALLFITIVSLIGCGFHLPMTGNVSDPARQIAASRKDMAEFATLWQAVAGRSAPAARAEAEAQVFNQMVVALDSRFG